MNRLRTQITALAAVSLCIGAVVAGAAGQSEQTRTLKVPENMMTEECHIKLSGITFTRSLNGAAAHAKVEDGRLTLASEARRDNFRDPDGKLSYSNAPLLLAEVDNKKPFTLDSKDHTHLSQHL